MLLMVNTKKELVFLEGNNNHYLEQHTRSKISLDSTSKF